jgi:hypothetical protein
MSKSIKKYNGDVQSENRLIRSKTIKKPKGIIIMDTWNNKQFPMDIFQVDTMSYNNSKLNDRFHETYGGSKRDIFSPWHFVVELVDEKPQVITTRPFSIKSGFTGYEDYLTIMIIGDSNKDIYPGKFYKAIAHSIINQFFFFQQFRIKSSEDIIYWTGKNFKKNELEKELYL